MLANTNTAIRNAATLTPLALVLAAGLTACGGKTVSSNTTGAKFTTSGADFTASGKASLAQASIDPTLAKSDQTRETFITEGASYDLPQQWVSEARDGRPFHYAWPRWQAPDVTPGPKSARLFAAQWHPQGCTKTTDRKR